MKHTVERNGKAIKIPRSNKVPLFEFPVKIDNIPITIRAACVYTGRRVNSVTLQVTWRLKFSDPLVRKHPDYKEIVKQVRNIRNICANSSLTGGWSFS